MKLAKARGFRVNINATLFDNADPERMAGFFDTVTALGIDGITVSPGYAYERAPDQEHFLNRQRTKELFRNIFRRDQVSPADSAGRSTSPACSSTSSPATRPITAPRGAIRCRNYFGWQRPCYLLGEGYAQSFKELMEETDWDAYGTGNYEKCADCMVHSGYEASAVIDSVQRPWKAARVALRGVKTEGEMAPDIALDRQRPAKYVFSGHVAEAMAAARERQAERRRGRLAVGRVERSATRHHIGLAQARRITLRSIRLQGAKHSVEGAGGSDQRRQRLPRLARHPQQAA